MYLNNHNCRQCGNEYLGRCMSRYNYGHDVSIREDICVDFVDGREPTSVIFDTVGQLENYLRKNFYKIDFANEFTRKQLVEMLRMLYPYQVKENYAGRAFCNMCKTRMVKHIEFYIKLHHIKCDAQ